MEDHGKSIRVYTFLFFFILVGFIGFLVYQGVTEPEFKKKAYPSGKIKKQKNESTLITEKYKDAA